MRHVKLFNSVALLASAAAAYVHGEISYGNMCLVGAAGWADAWLETGK